jgi:hypothetical protein
MAGEIEAPAALGRGDAGIAFRGSGVLPLLS